jgi:hypothetical protein
MRGDMVAGEPRLPMQRKFGLAEINPESERWSDSVRNEWELANLQKSAVETSRCTGMIFALLTLAVIAEYFLRISRLGERMGEIVQFIRKPDPDREAARLIQEARAIYEAIFPTEITDIAPIGDGDTST